MHRTHSVQLRGEPPQLNATLEHLVARIGDRIGRSLVEALSEPPAQAPRRRSKAICTREGCDRPVAAKGLCKSHYNLMLYHRRRGRDAAGGAARRRRGSARRP